MTQTIGLICVAAMVLLGTWFRISAVDRKYFWLDEVHAAMLRSGHNESDLIRLFDGTPRSLDEMARFVRTDSTTTLLGPAQALAERHPVHPPSYYCLLRAWSDVAGDSPAATRGLSVLFSLLCFPAVYWLGRELFRSRAAAYTALALWSVSPFEVVYAQEAKQYSMFALAILLSCAALLRAFRKRTTGSWTWYAASISLGLYTHLLFAPVFAVQVLFVGVSWAGRLRRVRTRKPLLQFAVAAMAGVLSFLPWVIVCLTDGRDSAVKIAAGHMAEAQRFAWLVAAWISNLGCTFVDLGIPSSAAAGGVYSLLWIGVVCLAVYAFRDVRRRTSRSAWLLLVLLAALPSLALIVPDLVLGGGRSMLVRYWTATSIAVLFTVAGALGLQLTAPGTFRRFAAGSALLLLLTVGVESCRRSAAADFWWNKDGVINNHRNAAAAYANMRRALSIIGRASRPLIVTETGRYQECELVIFSYYVQAPEVEWIGTLDPTRLVLPSDRTIFLYEAPATAELLSKQGWKFRSLEPSGVFLYAVRDITPPPGNERNPTEVPAATPASPEVARSGSE